MTSNLSTGSRIYPIPLDDEELELESVNQGSQSIIDLTESYDNTIDDGFDDDDAEEEEIVDIGDIEVLGSRTSVQVPISRDNHLWIDQESYDTEQESYDTEQGERISIKDCVELHDGDFICVCKIRFHIETGKTVLHGYRLRRRKHFRLFLGSSHVNELLLLIRANDDGSSDPFAQAVEQVDPLLVLRRREVNLTREAYPSGTFRGDPFYAQADMHDPEVLETVYNYGTLACRTVHIRYYQDYKRNRDDKILRKGSAGVFRDLQDKDIETILSSTAPASASNSTSELPHSYSPTKSVGSGYTYGDIFCGCGGAACGAHIAGLKVLFGVDMAKIPCLSFAQNFDVTTYHQDVANFLRKHAVRYRGLITVLHFSPPCQPFSHQKTKEHQLDAARRQAIITIGDIIRCIQPRIVTLEEVDGLWTIEDNYWWFQKLISLIWEAGYSVRWRIVPFSSWGTPQKRKRLWFYASAPGEPLPDFPQPTHGHEDPFLRPLRTVGDAISRIPANHPLMKGGTDLKESRPPYNAHTKLLKNLITCNGGNNYHPNGLRRFHHAGLAALQTFPLDFRFHGDNFGDIRTQIGNAVPPQASAPFFKAAVRALRMIDEGRSPRPFAQRVIPECPFFREFQALQDAGGSIQSPILIGGDETGSVSTTAQTTSASAATTTNSRSISLVDLTINDDDNEGTTE